MSKPGVAVFFNSVVFGVLISPLALLVCVARWSFNTIATAWEEL